MVRLLALLACLLLGIDDALAANALVGRWQAADEGVTLTFGDDGTLAIEAGNGAQQGRWSAEDGRLVMTLKPPGATESVTVTCLYTVQGDSLAIRPGDPKCGESEFRRAR